MSARVVTMKPADLEALLVSRLAEIRARQVAPPRSMPRPRARGRVGILTSSSVVAFMMIAIAVPVLGLHDPIDLSTSGSSRTYGGAIFNQGPLAGSAGTGVIDPFVRVNNNTGTSHGYNTDFRPLQFDEDSPWTESLLLSTVPQVEVGGVLYRKLNLDINEPSTTAGKLLSVDEIQLYLANSSVLRQFNTATQTFGAPAGATVSPVWDLDSFNGAHDTFVKLDATLSSGSGTSDMTFLVPEALFTGAGAGPSCQYGQAGCGLWLYVYSRFGDQSGMREEATFEEWNTEVLPFVQVSKTATGTFDRTVSWDIDKSVSPESWDLFQGDSGTSDYTVTLDKSVTEDNYEVSGTITLTNPSKLPDSDTNSPSARVTSIVDTFGGETATISCPGGPPPFTMARNTTKVCTYTISLAAEASGNNVVQVTVQNNPATFTATAPVSFTPNVTGFESVNVTDSVEGDLGTFADDGTAEYDATFSCDDDEGQHDNTATIDETGDSADASVTVTCHDLAVTKDADESLDRSYTWSIDKTSETVALTLQPGSTFDATYEVTVDVADTDDSNWAVSGDIEVNNPAPIDAILTGVADVITTGLAATVDCGVTFPHTLPAGETLDCSYSRALPDGATRTNTATATLQNHDYDSELNAIAAGTTDYEGSASVDFTGASVTEFDECVDVTDSFAGPLGTVCVGDAPETFSYPWTIGPYDADDCGDPFNVTNVADFVTNDTGATDNDDHTIVVTVVCPPSGGALFLIIDEDSIDNGIRFHDDPTLGQQNIFPSTETQFSDVDVNDQKASETMRDVLQYFIDNVGETIALHTGQVGDEGWFAPTRIPSSWGADVQAGIANLLDAAIPQSSLDEIPAVMPLRALGLEMLEGHTVCALVYDSDISINYFSSDPWTQGNLQGATLGIVAFTVLETGVNKMDDFSSSTLPEAQILIEDAGTVCQGPLELFDAPIPSSSSEPADIDPHSTADDAGYR